MLFSHDVVSQMRTGIIFLLLYVFRTRGLVLSAIFILCVFTAGPV